MSYHAAVPEFGCSACSGEDAEAAWRHYHAGGLVIDAWLVQESHFVVNLRHCSACGQGFVWVFTESVDWRGGEDPQHRVVLPVTPDEMTALARQGERVDLAALGALGTGRRYLVTDWPSGAPQRVTWGTGTFRPDAEP
jgi:hypothetical protein